MTLARALLSATALAAGAVLATLTGGDAVAQTVRNPWGSIPASTAVRAGYRGSVACGAQQCTQAPTAALCTNPCWAKVCTANPIVAGQCKAHVSSAFRGSAAQAPLTKQLVAPPSFSKAGERLATKRRTFDRSAVGATGHAGTLAGDQVGGRSAYVARPTATPARTAAVTAKQLREALRTGWEANGNAVASCDEYVYEKFYTYGRFLDEVAKVGGDPRQVFTLAYSPALRLSTRPNVRTRADTEARDVSGAVVPFGLPVGTRPKNEFVAALPIEGRALSYPTATATFVSGLPAECKPFQFDEADFGPAGRLAALRGKVRGTAWSTVNAASLGLGAQGWDDEDLDLRYQKQLDLRVLLSRRAAVLSEGSMDASQPFDPSQRVGGTGNLGADLALRLRNQYCGAAAVDREIQVAFREARDLGCFGLEAGPCDFSPRWFADLLLAESALARVERARSEALEECRDLTVPANYLGQAWTYKPDLADLVAYKNASGPTTNNAPAANWSTYKASNAAFDTFRLHARTFLAQAAADRRLAKVEAQVPDPARPGKRAVGKEVLDSGSIGDGDFGGGYTAKAGWRVYGFSADQLCTTKLDSWAELDAKGTVLHGEIPVGYFDARASAKQVTPAGGNPTMGFETALTARILGVTVFAGQYSKSYPSTFAIAASPQQTYASPRATASFVLGGVPLNVSAYVAGGAGVDMSLTGSATSSCVTAAASQLNLHLGGAVSPWAALEGVAEVSVGVPGVLEAGVRGRLVLLKASLPFHAKADATFDTGRAAITFRAQQQLRFALETVGGRVSVYLSSLGVDVYEEDLFSWEGVTYDAPLFRNDFSVGLKNAGVALQ